MQELLPAAQYTIQHTIHSKFTEMSGGGSVGRYRGVRVRYGVDSSVKMAFGRSLSIAALISEGILAPGEKLLTFDYMVR